MFRNMMFLSIFSRANQCLCRIVNPVRCCSLNEKRKCSTRTSTPGEPHNSGMFENESIINSTDKFEHLAHVMTPLWKLPYEDQLKEKYLWTSSVVNILSERLLSQRKGKRNIKISPKIYRVRPSPVTEEYRNKDEFSIRTGIDGDPKTVGFFVGKTSSDDTVCVPGTHLISLKQKHKDLAQKFEEYIRSSDLPTCIDFAPGGGNWRRFIVRSNEEGHVLAIAVCHPQDLSQERLDEEQQRLKEFFTSGPGKDNCPESLYFQSCRHARCSHQQAPFTLLHGKPFLMEKLAGKTFRISPDSFFQINTHAAEVLYESVLQQADLSSRSTLLDVCCGIGPISILAAEHVRGCVGIESLRDAVSDAKYNSMVNGITNVDFFYGSAKQKIGAILKELDLASDIVPVVNPGRAGLEPHVMKVLNECPQISTLVYISCKADMPSTQKNFVQLITEGRFHLRSVIPVDLFPHTLHTELVLTFKR